MAVQAYLPNLGTVIVTALIDSINPCAIGVLVVAAGLIEIKDFFWYGRGLTLSIPSDKAKKIYEMSRKITFPAMIVLGVFVAGVELPCTGGPYLAILVFLSQNFYFHYLL